MKRDAHATQESATTYTVTYTGSRDMDRDASYDYLRGLARSGHRVYVHGGRFGRDHVIEPEKQDATT